MTTFDRIAARIKARTGMPDLFLAADMERAELARRRARRAAVKAKATRRANIDAAIAACRAFEAMPAGTRDEAAYEAALRALRLS